MDEAPGSNHDYIGDDGALEHWMYTRKFREPSELLPELFLSLPDGITVPLNIVPPTKEQDVQGYTGD